MSFYQRIILQLVQSKKISPDDSILVVCAGNTDRNVFLAADCKNVTISNLDYHAGVTDYQPYQWELQDAEAINRQDNSIDWAVVHAGLHHCGSPHKAMCEMLRVAKKGIVVFEARDSFVMRSAIRLGLTSDYELEPIALTQGKSGGYRNTVIPNYIYRWREREIEKTANSFSPEYRHEFQYFYNFRIPTQRMAMSPSLLKRIAARVADLIAPLLRICIPKQGNEFAFLVSKTGPLQPWLKQENTAIVPNMEYINGLFNKGKYRGTVSVESESAPQ